MTESVRKPKGISCMDDRPPAVELFKNVKRRRINNEQNKWVQWVNNNTNEKSQFVRTLETLTLNKLMINMSRNKSSTFSKFYSRYQLCKGKLNQT